MRAAGIVTLCGLAALVEPRVAGACSCDTPRGTVLPADGATDVPLNGVILVGAYQEKPVITLADVTTGVTIETIELDFGNQLMLRPAGLLSPQSTYSVSFTPAPGGDVLSTSFTTGSTTDDSPPSYAGLTAFAPVALPRPDPDVCANTCLGGNGWFRRMTLDLPDPPADVASLVVRVYDPDVPGDPDTYIAVYRPATLTVIRELDDGGGYCDRFDLPDYLPGQTYAAEVLAFDQAGNRAPPAPAVTATAPECAEASFGDSCTPIECITPGGGASATGCAVGSRAQGQASERGAALALLGLSLLAALFRAPRSPSSSPTLASRAARTPRTSPSPTRRGTWSWSRRRARRGEP